jgi:hypothetical protein
MPMISVRMPDEYLPKIECRGEKATVIRESLDRYFLLLDRARIDLQDIFTDTELQLMADASNGVIYEAWSIPHMAMGIADSMSLDNLGEKWGVNADQLLAKLKNLDAASSFALVDALERFWESCGRGGSSAQERHSQIGVVSFTLS